MKSKPKYVYQVYSPMPYCEIYLVEATSKREARELFETRLARDEDYECIGGNLSRRKKEIRGKKIK